jgi:ABC-2 type transport system ATP-binding protein
MIQAKHLTKWYGPLRAVNNVSFQIEKGEIVGFLGPNGAGKSTTMRILTCYMPADGGQASIANHDVFEESLEVRKRIGYLPESTPLYLEMRVREFLDFSAKIRGIVGPDRRSAIKQAAERCWIGDVINRPIGQLSKGYRQRVGLAQAMLHDPDVLILDEPTIGLDPNQIRETRSLIKDLGKKHTMLISSHILPEVEATCDRTIIISRGEIVASGSPQQLKDRVTSGSRLIAEIRGASADEVSTAVEGVDGVTNVDAQLDDGWNRLRITTGKGRDVREDLFRLVQRKDWTLREMRLETASLEEFFVQITAEQSLRPAS